MDVKISTSEFAQESQAVANAATVLARIGRRYVACLQGVKACGYQSDVSGASIDERCSLVTGVIAQFEEATSGVTVAAKRFVEGIEQADKTL